MSDPLSPPPYQAPPQQPPASSFNPASVDPKDWGILGAGLLTLIFSFVSYYTVTVSYSGSIASLSGVSNSGSVNAWHGFFGWAAALLALAGSAVLAGKIFGVLPPNIPARLVGLGAYAAALLFVIIAAFFTPGASSTTDFEGYHVSYGRGLGFWLDLILVLAGGVLTYLQFTKEGGVLPWAKPQQQAQQPGYPQQPPTTPPQY